MPFCLSRFAYNKLTNSMQVMTTKLVSAPSGNVIGGTLNQADRTAPYGTAATTVFRPYIADPELTRDKTSRILRKR